MPKLLPGSVYFHTFMQYIQFKIICFYHALLMFQVLVSSLKISALQDSMNKEREEQKRQLDYIGEYTCFH